MLADRTVPASPNRRSLQVALGLAWLLAMPLAARAASQTPGAEPERRTPDIGVSVDPAVELVSLVARLAGNPEYRSDGAESPYTRAADAHFGPFVDHPAVLRMRHLRSSFGISYDAVASLGVHLEWRPDSREKLVERIDLVGARGRLEARWSGGVARSFVEDLRSFVRDTDFDGFLAQHADLHRIAEERFRARLAEGFDQAWFERFFARADGTSPADKSAATAPSLKLRIGLLMGGNNYGVGVDYPDGRVDLTPCIGAWDWDAEGLPLFGADVLPIVIHEFSHSYVNPLVDANLERFEPAGELLFPPVRETMKAQAYGDWRTVVSETIVRAAVLRYMVDAGSAKRTLGQLRGEDVGRGFAVVPALEEALGRYAGARERYPDLASFLPELVAVFEAAAETERELAERRPKLLALAPADGDQAVDPSVTELSFEFDRPMLTTGYSVVGGGDDFPEVTGTPSWDATGTVLTIPVRLKPDQEYHFSLNGPRHSGFRGREHGLALAPVRVSFRTAP